MEEKNLKILKEIHKGTVMGMNSISFVAEKLDNSNKNNNRNKLSNKDIEFIPITVPL